MITCVLNKKRHFGLNCDSQNKKEKWLEAAFAWKGTAVRTGNGTKLSVPVDVAASL